MLIKIPAKFFTDLKRTVLNFIWKSKKPKIAKTILYTKETSGGIKSGGIQTLLKATVLKTA